MASDRLLHLATHTEMEQDLVSQTGNPSTRPTGDTLVIKEQLRAQSSKPPKPFDDQINLHGGSAGDADIDEI